MSRDTMLNFRGVKIQYWKIVELFHGDREKIGYLLSSARKTIIIYIVPRTYEVPGLILYR